MKKSIINIIILAVSIINVVLCGILVFAIVPAMTSTNRMVNSICELIDLELEGQKSTEPIDYVPIDKIKLYDIDEQLTITLKKGADSKTHYMILKVSLAMNSAHKDYDKYIEVLPTQESLIKNKIIEIVGKYNLEEARAYTSVIKDEILKALQEMYNSDFIIEISFGELTFS